MLHGLIRSLLTAARWGLTGLALLVAALWVQSYLYPIGYVHHNTQQPHPQFMYGVWSTEGRLGIGKEAFASYLPLGLHSGWVEGLTAENLDNSYVSTSPRNSFRLAGIYSFREQYYPHRALLIPHWLVLLPIALAAAPLWIVWWRGRRVAAGLCSRCGYDLCASPGDCPECGQPQPQQIVAD